jgi:hypothetical protein
MVLNVGCSECQIEMEGVEGGFDIEMDVEEKEEGSGIYTGTPSHQ